MGDHVGIPGVVLLLFSLSVGEGHTLYSVKLVVSVGGRAHSLFCQASVLLREGKGSLFILSS